jgi:acetyl-CoA synthetase
VAAVVLKAGYQPSEQLRKELIELIRTQIGPIATPKTVLFVSKLPKTRSGKIMRRLLKDIMEGRPLGDTTTLEDPTAVEELLKAWEEFKRSMSGS